jgi:parallel beta-helix repeat protein
VRLIYSDRTIIQNNIFTDNLYALGIYDSNESMVSGNEITANEIGLHLMDAYYNIIKDNNITSNTDCGVKLFASHSNTIYHNRIIGNAVQAEDDGSNSWDDGYPSGGNWWSDYSGWDVKSGSSQDQPVADGIGDIAYAIDGDSFDNYPLWTPAGVDYVVMRDGPNGTQSESPSDATIGFDFEITVWAGGYNNTLGYVMDINATWSVTNTLGSTATITNATGVSTSFNSGMTEGIVHLMAEYNGTTDVVNATVVMIQPDIVVDGVGDGVYENPPTVAQHIHDWVLAGSTKNYSIQLQNDGNYTDQWVLAWDISSFPAGWAASMYNEDTATDLTADLMADGMIEFNHIPIGGMINLTLAIHSHVSAVPGDEALVRLGLFSMMSQENDSFAVFTVIPGVDSIMLTDSPGGAPLNLVNMAAQGNVTAYASSYNNTFGYIGLIPVDWSCSPVLGTFDNITGTSTTFTAGWAGGWANITGTDGTMTDSFAIFFNGDVTDPVSACNVTGAYWRNSLPLTITATATDPESGLAQVRLWYSYSADNVSFGAYQLAGTDFAAPWSFTFDFPAGAGYYRFYSQAIDNVGNPEAAPAVPDVEYAYDDALPTSACDVIGAYWYASSINITATAVDSHSGLASVSLYYRFSSDNSTWGAWTLVSTDIATPWSWSFAFPDGDGYYEFAARAADVAGNMEALPAAADVRSGYDTTGPATAIALGEPNYPYSWFYNNTWYNFSFINATTLITLPASDSGSLVNQTWYRMFLWGTGIHDLSILEIRDYSAIWTNWTKFTGPFTVPTGGSDYVYGYIEFYTTDNIGNNGSLGNITIIVESVPPTVALAITTPNSSINPTYITSATAFNLTADDDWDSGVAGIWYRIDGGAWINYAGNFTLTGAGGHNISYYAQDNLGQNSTVITKYVWLDETTPTTGREISGPQYGQFINANTLIYLNSTDSGSGVSVIQYRINGGAWLNYTGPLNFSVDGTYLIEYHAIDNVHNSEPLKEIELIVENALPVPGHSITGPSHIMPGGPWYITSQTNVSLLADDAGSGVAEIWYSLDNGTWTLFSSRLDLTPGAHDIQYYAVDNLGHASELFSLHLFLDDTPPEIRFTGPSPDNGVIYMKSGWMVSISAIDRGVGVEVIYFSLDGGTTWLVYSDLITFTENGTLMCRAVDLLGNIGDPVTVTIEIIPEDVGTGSWWWILIIIICVIIGVILGYWLISRKGGQPPEDEPKEPVESVAGNPIGGLQIPSDKPRPENSSREADQGPDDDGDGLPTDPEAAAEGSTQGGPQARGNSPTHIGSGPKPKGSDFKSHSGDDAGVSNPTVTPPPGNLPPVPNAILEVKKPGTGP